jgi:hypothetical protein
MADARTLLLAGVATRLQVEDEVLAAAVANGLGDCPSASAAPELHITDAAPSPPLPDEEPDGIYQAVRVWRRDEVLSIAWGSVLSARVDGTTAVLGRAEASADDVIRAVRQVLPFVIGHLLGTHGVVVLHAGAVLVDGGAALVLGTTGAGKSTLVFAARSAGRGILSDDLVAVRAGDGGPVVIGIPRPLALAADGPDGLPSDAKAIGSDGRGRWQFPLEGVRDAHPVAAVLVVEHSAEQEGHLEALAASELLEVVVNASLAAADPARLRAAFPVLASVSRLPGWLLGHGADPETRMDVGARLLDVVDGRAASDQVSRLRR